MPGLSLNRSRHTLRRQSFLPSIRSDSFAANACFAFRRETIFFPVWASISRRVFPAMRPPCAATMRFAAMVRGLRSLEISVVVASASMFNTNSRLVILSRRLSVFSPLNCLYWRVVIPDQPSVIISVSVANSCPFFMPRRSHSSVSSLRTSMDFSRWFIQFSEYPLRW